MRQGLHELFERRLLILSRRAICHTRKQSSSSITLTNKYLWILVTSLVEVSGWLNGLWIVRLPHPKATASIFRQDFSSLLWLCIMAVGSPDSENRFHIGSRPRYVFIVRVVDGAERRHDVLHAIFILPNMEYSVIHGYPFCRLSSPIPTSIFRSVESVIVAFMPCSLT